MEIYERYMLSMGMAREELASSFTSDEVSNVMGELMNPGGGRLHGQVRRELQTHTHKTSPRCW